MSQVSKYKLDNKVYEKIFSLFPQFLSRMIGRGKQQELIDAFFTKTEKIVLAKRIAIAFMLTKGYTYNSIVGTIKVSHGTVANIADSLKSNDASIKSELEGIAKEESFVAFLTTIGYKIETALPPKNSNWSEWRRRIEKEKQLKKQPF